MRMLIYNVLKVGWLERSGFYNSVEESLLEQARGMSRGYGNNENKVYVGNLPSDIRSRDLEDIFYKYGKIVDVDLHNRKGPPFAFVEFEDPR